MAARLADGGHAGRVPLGDLVQMWDAAVSGEADDPLPPDATGDDGDLEGLFEPQAVQWF